MEPGSAGIAKPTISVVPAGKERVLTILQLPAIAKSYTEVTAPSLIHGCI